MNVNKIDIVCDIDDVIRDMNKAIMHDLRLFHRTDAVGDYSYDNPLVRELFDWYHTQDFYVDVFENSPINTEMINMLNVLLHTGKISLCFLSSNSILAVQKFTRNQILSLIPYEAPAYFVDRADLKEPFVENILKKNKVLFIDDRIDTCMAFMKKGHDVFWYTRNIPKNIISDYLDNIPDTDKETLQRGGTTQLSSFIETLGRN